MHFPIVKAARIVQSGGVIIYPTEGVFGLGCDPANQRAVERILAIKRRKASQGLILIAANRRQLDPWIETHADLTSDATHPITWIVPASRFVPAWIRGEHPGVAVRLTSHPVAAALCEIAGSAIVSTSANISGRPPARNTYVLHHQFRALVDCIVRGDCGPSVGPSEIRVLGSEKVLRKAASSL